MLDQTVEVPCFFCNAGIESQKRLKTIGKYGLVRCSCGFIFINPRDTQEKTISFYEKDDLKNFSYYLACEKADSVHFLKVLTLLKSISLFKNVKKPSILDIGSGVGTFLSIAEQQGYLVDGVEINTLSKEYSLKRTKGNVYSSLKEIKKRYAIIHLGDVLEHIYNPKSFILECKNLLKSDGLLIAIVPDFEVLIVKLLQVKPREHLTYFTKKTLRLLLEQQGFKVLYLDRFCKERSLEDLPLGSTFNNRPIIKQFLRFLVFFHLHKLIERILRIIPDELIIIAQKR